MKPGLKKLLIGIGIIFKGYMNAGKHLITSLFWSMGGQVGAMLISLTTNVILARVLTPLEFGQIGIIMFFILICNVLTESGLGGALVRQLDVSERDFSTVFVFNIGLSIILYSVLYYVAGLIASYYSDIELESLIQVAGLVILINSFQVIQNAKLVREMRFKRKSLYYFNAVLIASLIGVFLAYEGYGVWSLVFLQITLASLLTIQLWIFEGVYFRLTFSKSSFSSLFKFGINTTLASILNTGFDNIYQLILARNFSISQVGLFYQGKKLQDVPNNVIKLSSLNVVYSSLSKHQSNKDSFLTEFHKIINPLMLISGAIALVFLIFSEGILSLLYGEKWLEAEFYMQVLAVGSFFYLLEIFNRLIFKVFNRTEKILYLELLKKGIQLVTIFIGLHLKSIEILIYGFLLTNMISFVINYFYSRRILGIVNWDGMKRVVKIVMILLTLFLVSDLAFRELDFLPVEQLYFIPVILLLYAIFLKAFQVTNVLSDLKAIFYTPK